MRTEIPGTFVARIALRTRVLSLVVYTALRLCVPAGAQILKTPDSAGPQKLMITILDGDGALNNIRQRDAREPIVQVTDENHKPVGGALVLFTIHGGANGASATFNGAQTLTVRTGEDGIAHASGLQVARSPGSFTVSVTATAAVAAGVTIAAAQVLIHQSNFIGPLSTATSSSASSASSASSSISGASGSASGASGSASGASGTAGASSSGATVTHTGLSKLVHLGKTGSIVAGTAAAAAVVVVVVVTTQNNPTSLSLGTSTVGHP